ncbi:Delta(1)-pyrroline-2-carboxylate reductase 1 [Pseudomonas fluorescens]|nr:Delta(1)-pyrroline-2-carboxylate reductase 1 [Pseudomonas fluorescens]
MNNDNNSCRSRDGSIVVCDRAKTASLLSFPALIIALAQAAKELAQGKISSPERMVVPMGEGVLLSMPATAGDVGIHKLVNVHPGNASLNLPSIHGVVTVCDAETGQIRCLLDGPEVTGRRTAAVSMLAVQTFLQRPPAEVLLYGTGVQARYHVEAIHALYPETTIWVKGLDDKNSRDFCEQVSIIHQQTKPLNGLIGEKVEVVITVTTSTVPVYNEPPRIGRLVIGVGAFKPEMAELGKQTLAGSRIYADEPTGVRAEAGDLIQAEIDWDQLSSLAAALGGDLDNSKPVVFKSVGTGAWDLAAARVALSTLNI